MTNYRLREIGKGLKAGKCWIEGKVSGGDRWPDEPHYWIVTDGEHQATHHVPVDDRPSWGRYVRQ